MSNPLGVGTTPTASAKINNLNNAANAAIQIYQVWSMFHHQKNDNGAALPPAQMPDPQESEQSQLAQMQADAANQIEQANTLMASRNGAASDPSGGSSNALSAFDALFDSGQPSGTSTSAITSLLADPAHTDTTSIAMEFSIFVLPWPFTQFYLHPLLTRRAEDTASNSSSDLR